MNLILFMLAACGPRCTVEAQAWDLVPPDATDCGDDFVCLGDALVSGEPAVAQSSIQGIDSVITSALAWTGDRLWSLTSDSFGGPLNHAVDGRECVDPEIVDGELSCRRMAPPGNHYAVCGVHGGEVPAALPFEP